MPRQPTDEQTTQTGDEFTDTEQATDTRSGQGKVRGELDSDPITEQRIGDPNIINR
jgi:hypothetical protein